MRFEIHALAIAHTDYKEKFAIPRQSGLVPAAQASIELLAPYNTSAWVAGLEGASHIWLEFIFHANQGVEARPKVRPPRLGGNQKVGVFATRSPVRPNGIGLSVVELLSVDATNDGVELKVAGADLLDQTPIIDIKPYLPYADCLAHAQSDLAAQAPDVLPVALAPQVQQQLRGCEQLQQLISQTLRYDPRPQYLALEELAAKPPRRFAARMGDKDVVWIYRRTNAGGYEIYVERLDREPSAEQ